MNKPSIDQQITFLYTRDLDATTRFYEEVVRLPLVLDQGSCRIYRTVGDAYVGFCERATAPDEPQGILFTLVADDVDGWYEHFISHGVEVTHAPAVNETYGIYHFFVQDPNGYTIEVQRFLDPDWSEREVLRDS